MLLSFAQFEREVTAERIRDKIAASKKKGMWMGGPVPLGYDVNDRRLVANRIEADTVNQIFRLYVELGTVRRLQDELDRLGIVTKAVLKLLERQQGATVAQLGAGLSISPLDFRCEESGSVTVR